MNAPEITTFCIYLVVILFVGIISYRLTDDLSDYVLGGRRLGAIVAALSAGASDMSGWLLLGLPGAIYARGLNQIWIAGGLSLGAYLNWRFVAKRLRNETERLGDAITLPDYLENRFNDRSKALRVVSAVVILVFFTIYTASGLVSGAILFEKSFGLDYSLALVLGALVIVTYTFLGGFLAVSWTDVIQGILMFCALVAVPMVALTRQGGWTEAVGAISEINPNFLNVFGEMTLPAIISLTAWGLGYFGQPHILARFMAIKSASDIPKARIIGMSWMIISLVGAMFTGFIGIAHFVSAPLQNPETVFIALSQTLFNPWVSGCLIAAILSAVMSTIDSQLLVCSSAITEDFYRSFIRRHATQKELVRVGRSAVIVIAVLAVYMARDPDSMVLELVAYAWAGFGAAFGPVVILSLFWGSMTKNGAMAGIVVGAVTVIAWKNMEGGIFDLYEILPGFILSWLGITVVSVLESRKVAESQSRRVAP